MGEVVKTKVGRRKAFALLIGDIIWMSEPITQTFGRAMISIGMAIISIFMVTMSVVIDVVMMESRRVWHLGQSVAWICQSFFFAVIGVRYSHVGYMRSIWKDRVDGA